MHDSIPWLLVTESNSYNTNFHLYSVRVLTKQIVEIKEIQSCRYAFCLFWIKMRGKKKRMVRRGGADGINLSRTGMFLEVGFFFSF